MFMAKKITYLLNWRGGGIKMLSLTYLFGVDGGVCFQGYSLILFKWHCL